MLSASSPIQILERRKSTRRETRCNLRASSLSGNDKRAVSDSDTLMGPLEITDGWKCVAQKETKNRIRVRDNIRYHRHPFGSFAVSSLRRSFSSAARFDFHWTKSDTCNYCQRSFDCEQLSHSCL